MFLHGFDFVLSPDRRAVMGDYALEPSELAAEIRAGTNLARRDMESALLTVLKASLIGGGMGRKDAESKAFEILHNGVGSYERSREIVMKLLEGI